MKKKKMNKEMFKIIKVNESFKKFLLELNKSYEFKDDEVKNLNILCEHLTNMNVLFNNIEKGIKDKKQLV